MKFYKKINSVIKFYLIASIYKQSQTPGESILIVTNTLNEDTSSQIS